MAFQMKRFNMAIVALFFLALLIPQSLFADEFPSKPVTIIVPSRAGGGHDLTFRAVTSVAADYLGQPMVVKLMPGGRGAIGSDYVAKAKPDGYTLLGGGLGWSSATPAIEGRSKGPDDLVSICRINYNSIMIVARGDAPFKNFKELMAWIKANPGELIIGTGSRYIQDDFFWRKMMNEKGISVKIVPYQGGGAQFTAVLGGHSDVGGALVAMYLPFKPTGKLIPMLWLDKERHPLIPDVPTSFEEEEGVDFVSRMWRGVLAPKGTPRPIVDKLGVVFKKITDDTSFKRMMKRYGDSIDYLGPDEFAKVWRAEYEDFKAFAKTLKK
jgi:tripartite-type tricarboxylate transporter receptor subunit TctC